MNVLRQRSRTGRLLTAGVVAAAILAATTACGSGSQSSSSGGSVAAASSSAYKVAPRTIGYVDLIASGPMQRRYYSYFESAAKELGWTVQLQDAKGDPTQANTAAVNLLNQGIDALVVSCADSAPMRPALQLAKQKNIPAIQVGCPMTDETAWDASFPIDDAAVGKELGEYVAQQIGQGAKVGILGDTTILAGKIRGEGLQEGMAPANPEIVGNQSVSLTDPVNASRSTVQSYLTANPDLKAVVAVYDFFAPPAGDTIKSAGKTDQVGVYSFFADTVNAPYMRTPGSALKAVADGPVEQVSLVAADQLLAHLEKNQPFDPSAAKKLDIKYEIFTADNLPPASDDYLTPYPVDKYLPAYEQRWATEYSAK